MKAPGWKLARLTRAILIESELPSWLFMSISGFEDNIVLLDLGRCREAIVSGSQKTRRDLKEKKEIGNIKGEKEANVKMAFEERSPLRLSMFPNVPPFIRVLPPGILFISHHQVLTP